MVQLFSNFFLIDQKDFKKNSLIDNIYTIYFDNVDDVYKQSLKKIFKLQEVIIIYSDKQVAKYFVSLIMYNITKDTSYKSFLELMFLNDCQHLL
jgi:hypothetical protein